MINIAAIQMVSTNCVETNLKSAEKLIIQAASSKVKTLVVLPENFALMGKNSADTIAIAEEFGSGKIQSFLAQQAKQHQLWLLGGSIPLKTVNPSRAFSTSLLYNPKGECIARYDKCHLFDVNINNNTEKESYKESDTFEAGNQWVVAKTEIGNIGLSICYDLRFPELYRNMHQHRVQIITVPAAFTLTTGKAHWESLLKARAIENLCYVIAANQSGTHANGRETWGHTMIIDPWGTILAQVEKQVGVACATIDLHKQAKMRQEFPVLSHIKMNNDTKSVNEL